MLDMAPIGIELKANAMPKINTIALIAATALTGCTAEFFPEQDSRIEQAPMSAESREAVRNYFLQKDAKAFAFNPQTGQGILAAGYTTIAGAEAAALARCEALTGSPCTTFALNNQIVWQADAAAQIEPSAGPAAPIPVTALHRTTANVRMRIGPGLNFKVIATLNADETLEITGQEGDWQAIRRQDGSIGFIHGDYLAEIEPANGTQ